MRLGLSNPNDLPLDVAVVIEENAAISPPQKKTDEKPDAANIVQRLLAIRERIFWLHAVWATSLAPHVAGEADRYRELFRELGEELRKIDPDALNRIVSGYESLLLAQPLRKPSVPLAAQEWHEFLGEVRRERRQPPKQKPPGYVPDGLERFV